MSIIIHEFLHALGAIHEQNRPDRDLHIKVNWDNVGPEIYVSQFYKASWQYLSGLSPKCPDLFWDYLINGGDRPDYDSCVSGVEVNLETDLPYDLDSIMHYRRYAYDIIFHVFKSM